MRSRRPKVGVAARMMPRLKVVDLNPHLSCILCGGYFIDATTITECLHSFCRACIVRYLETSQYCPVCEVQVHKSKPLRSDKILQDIVYKLVPGLFHNEMKKRRELYASQPPEALKESRDAEDRGECLDEKFIYAPDEIFSLSVEYGKEVENDESASEDDCIPSRRFLRCPAALTIGHLKKFVRMKYGIPNSYEIDLRYDQESLHDEYTLMDVAYIFLWRRKGPMRFFYKIVERPPKKPKSDHIFVDVDAKEPEKEPETETKTEIEAECTPPVSLPQKRASEKDVTGHCPPEKDNTGGISVTEPVGQILPADSQAVKISETVDPDEKKALRVETTTESKTFEDSAITPGAVSKKESKSLPPFKFPPTTTTTSSSLMASESKPAVMTVAPLTKPSSSLPTTSSSSTPATSGTVTHGLYTGISIKKSPPNTLPPFKISAHLLPPRVPPLKLSPPRFSKLENCLRELSSSSKKSSTSRKSKSSRGGGSSDKLELKVAQLKSGVSKCVAPIVISVPPEAKLDCRKDLLLVRDHHHHQVVKRAEEAVQPPKEPPHPFVPLTPTLPSPPASVPSKASSEEDKMDLDSEDLFEGPLVIAEPEIPPKEDSNSSGGQSRDAPLEPSREEEESAAKPPPEDSEDEEIDVVDDGEVDSGRGSDVSSRTRSLCGDDDPLGSPDSGVVLPKTPDAERPPHQHPLPNRTFPKSPTAAETLVRNGVEAFGGALDLSTCGSRKRGHDGSDDGPVFHRAKQVANPAVLDKSRQTTTPCVSPDHSPFKVLAPEISHLYKGSKHHHESSRSSGGGSFKCRGNNLAVINPNPNGHIPKLVIRNLGPNRAGHERFHHHHHHHHHNHHHQRM